MVAASTVHSFYDPTDDRKHLVWGHRVAPASVLIEDPAEIEMDDVEFELYQRAADEIAEEVMDAEFELARVEREEFLFNVLNARMIDPALDAV